MTSVSPLVVQESALNLSNGSEVNNAKDTSSMLSPTATTHALKRELLIDEDEDNTEAMETVVPSSTVSANNGRSHSIDAILGLRAAAAASSTAATVAAAALAHERFGRLLCAQSPMGAPYSLKLSPNSLLHHVQAAGGGGSSSGLFPGPPPPPLAALTSPHLLAQSPVSDRMVGTSRTNGPSCGSTLQQKLALGKRNQELWEQGL